MPKLIHSPPRNHRHKASGQAVVTINGKDRYLGPRRSKQSKAEHDQLVSEWLANRRRAGRACTARGA